MKYDVGLQLFRGSVMNVRLPKWLMSTLIGAVVAISALLVLPTQPPGWDGVFQEISARTQYKMSRARGAMKHAPGLEFYYQSRRYGNPGVNVDRRQLEVQLEVESRFNKGFGKSSVANQWEVLGPGNVAGRVRAIAFRHDDQNVVFAGGASGGVFKSTNGGQGDWRPVMDFAEAIPVGALAVDPHNSDIVYAGTGEPTMELAKSHGAPSYSGVGVMKSVDGGETWSLLPWPLNSSAVHRIIIDPRDSDVLLVATRSNMYRSEDAGETWTRVQSGIITSVEFKPDNPEIVYSTFGNDNGSGLNGVYRSTDGGRQFTWNKISENFPAGDSVGRIELAVTPASPDLVFAFAMRSRKYASGSSDFLAIMRSTDSGDSWERLPTNLPSSFTGGQGFYNLCAIISPTNADTILAGGIELWRSTNGGFGWARVTQGNAPVHVDQHVLKFTPTNSHLYVGNDGGVYRSANMGTSWTPLDRTLETIQFYTLAYDPNNPDRFYGGAQDHGIFQSFNISAREWRIRRGGDGGYVVVDPHNPNIIYSRLAVEGGGNPVPARSVNGGQSWTRLDNGFGEDRFNWLPPMMLSPVDNQRMYTASQFVYSAKPVNEGNPRWSAVSPDLTKRSSVLSIISTIDICESNPNVMYVGCGDGTVQYCDNLGAFDVDWYNITGNLPNRWVSRVKVDRRDPAIAYVVFSGYGTPRVYKTTNFGQEWMDISGNLPDLPVNAIAISRTNPDNILFVGTDFGVWYTENAGATWARFGTGLPNVVIYDLDIDPLNRLIAATHGRGMWITSSILSVDETPVAEHFALRQNYPNPARSDRGTTIEFTLKESANVTLNIYDVSGRLVMKVDEGRMSPGVHSRLVNTATIRDGVYFYTLSDGERSASRKMIVLN